MTSAARSPRSRRFSQVPIQKKSRIFGIFGERGQGKSLAMCAMAEAEHRRNPSRPIFYFPADYAYVHGEPLELRDMVTFPERLWHATLLVDEAQVLWSKFRTSTYGNRAGMTFLQQIRKRGCDLVYTTNSPDQLDPATAEQTDYHCYCTKFDDPRCDPDKFEYHLADCRDWVSQRWVDTRRRHGSSGSHKDGRKRFYRRIDNIIRYYTLYNTAAILSSREINALSARAVRQADADEKMGMSMDQLCSLLRREIVPELVRSGVTAINASGFADHLVKTRGITVEPNALGKACNQIGLIQTRTMSKRTYKLPFAEDVKDWQDGLIYSED
jgi:hypothetical protein